MDDLSNDELEKRKKAVFDGMSDRRRKHILKRGYERWDPFLPPQDPIDIRKDKTRRTTQALIREFLQSLNSSDYNNDFARGAFELCLGIINDDQRMIGMYEFSIWYQTLLKKEGLDKP